MGEQRPFGDNFSDKIRTEITSACTYTHGDKVKDKIRAEITYKLKPDGKYEHTKCEG